MTSIDADTWDEFCLFACRIAKETASEDWRFAFRGLSDASWRILATIDRSRSFSGTSERSRYEDRLLNVFRREALAYIEPGSDVPAGQALALLARHHGLPSSWTDWSTSPYVAAYFAFSSALVTVDRVAIWLMDRDKLPKTFNDLDLIDDPMLLRFNTRALRQRGVFIRIPDANSDLTTVLGDALIKLTLPTTIMKDALADLSYMALNASTLFNDLDGAARAASDRMRLGF